MHTGYVYIQHQQLQHPEATLPNLIPVLSVLAWQVRSRQGGPKLLHALFLLFSWLKTRVWMCAHGQDTLSY